MARYLPPVGLDPRYHDHAYRDDIGEGRPRFRIAGKAILERLVDTRRRPRHPVEEIDMTEYPEHEKLKALAGANQVVGNFIEWLGENGYVIARYDPHDRLYPAYERLDKLIADHFEINEQRLEEEKLAMLASLRN